MLIIHITAAYSNAVLVAILPHISNFAKKLDLPISQPVTVSQVARFNVSPLKEDIGGSVWLTNHYQFVFGNGYLRAYQSPTNWFNNNYDNWDDARYFKRYVGKDNMTTNETIEFARHSFHELGYQSKDFDVESPPTRFEGPVNSRRLGHLPYCHIEWDSPDSKIQSLLGLDFSVEFDVDMQRKQIVGMNLSGRKFFKSNPKVAVVPELETNYQRAGTVGQFAHFFNREPAIHMTSAYSNATLKATLPYISDFAAQLNLPIAQPVTANQVVLSIPPQYKPPHSKSYFEERLILTNHYWFTFMAGCVCQFGSPDNWFEEKETRTNWPVYTDKTCINTNEAIQLARDTFHKLGFKLEEPHIDAPPTTFAIAIERKSVKEQTRYAYCQIDWDSPEMEIDGEYHVEFDIDMQRKQVVGMFLSSTYFSRPDPKIDVVPELESDYRRHISGKMFIRAKAPDLIRTSNPSLTHLKKSSPGIQTNPAAPPVR